jgi:hypothetical protein
LTDGERVVSWEEVGRRSRENVEWKSGERRKGLHAPGGSGEGGSQERYEGAKPLAISRGKTSCCCSRGVEVEGGGRLRILFGGAQVRPRSEGQIAFRVERGGWAGDEEFIYRMIRGDGEGEGEEGEGYRIWQKRRRMKKKKKKDDDDRGRMIYPGR